MTEPVPPRSWSARAGLAFAASLLVVEIVAAFLFCAGSFALPFALHAAASVAANTLVWRRGGVADAPIATLRMSGMLLPFLGPLAPLAAIALLLGQIAPHRPPPDAATWHEHLFPNLAADPIADRMAQIARRQPPSATGEDVESFYDVLRWGTLPEREHVLSLISRSFRAEFAPVLRTALSSDDLGLRAQAAAGLSLLETRTTARLGELQTMLETTGSETAARALAQALADAAHSGLYDANRSTEMRREIVALLAPIVERTGDPALAAQLGRTLIQLGDLDRAVATLTHSVETRLDAPSDAALNWLMEGLYRQGDYAKLADLLQRRRDQAKALVAGDGPLAPALAFWGPAA